MSAGKSEGASTMPSEYWVSRPAAAAYQHRVSQQHRRHVHALQVTACVELRAPAIIQAASATIGDQTSRRQLVVNTSSHQSKLAAALAECGRASAVHFGKIGNTGVHELAHLPAPIEQCDAATTNITSAMVPTPAQQAPTSSSSRARKSRLWHHIGHELLLSCRSGVSPTRFPNFTFLSTTAEPPLSTSAIHKSLILATFLVAPRQRCRWNVEATAKPTLGRTVWFGGIGGRGIMVSVAELR
ncbi:hypothetical protein CF326_g8534 [Tilletia indica]|nr:hypothetical protein CF326_g8534 [Tilletia indica]